MFQIKLLFFLSCIFALNNASFFDFFHLSKQQHRDITFHHKFDAECGPNESLNSNCTLYIFVDESTPQSCHQEKTFFRVAASILNQLPDGNSYGNKYFANMSEPGSDWCEFEYNNKLEAIQDGNGSIVYHWCNEHGNLTYFTDALNYLLKTSNRFANVGVFLHGQTDLMIDIAGSLKVAQQIAAKSNMIVYVWDHTYDPDETGLFATLTGNKTGHIIRSSTDQSELLEKVQKQLIPDFISIGCGSNVPSTTPLPPGCSLLIFVEESSNAIGFDAKLMFLRLVQQIASTVSNGNANQRFAISFFATEIYYPIIPQSFMDFNASINKYMNDINFGNFPNGNKIYLQPILNNLNTLVNSKLYPNYAVLFMGEIQSVLDIGKAFPLAKSIASSGADVYVLDESIAFPSSTSFWSALTNGLNGHIVNGTGASMDSLFQTFNANLIQEFKFMQC